MDFITFLILAFNGLVIFNFIYGTKNKFLALGAGMIIGPLGLLVLLYFVSYFFKGSFYHSILFISYTLICLRLFFISKSRLGFLFKFKGSYKNFIFLPVLIFYLWLFFSLTLAASENIGVDSYIYSGIASSFSKGTYPSVLPWQPQFLAVYHSGAFILEGALISMTGGSYFIIHLLFSGYLLIALLFLLFGFSREYSRSLISTLPAVLGLVIFGGPPLLVKGIFSFLQNLHSLAVLTKYPQFLDTRRVLGDGAGEPSELVYYIFYTFALAIFLLFIVFLFKKTARSNIIYKYLLLIVLLILNLSVDETFFPIEIVLFAYFFIYENISLGFKRFLTHSMVLIICFVSLFMIVQNPVRDSVFTTSPETQRFTVFYPYFTDIAYPLYSEVKNNQPNIYRVFSEKDKTNLALTELSGRWLRYSKGHFGYSGDTFWYYPSLLEIGLFTLILSLIIRSKMAFVISISSLLSFISGLIFTNTFFGTNYIRFMNQGYQLGLISLGIMIVGLFSKKDMKFLALGFFLLLILTPSIITAHSRVLNMINNRNKAYIPFTLYNEQIYRKFFQKVSSFVPHDKRIIFIDGFPFNKINPTINLKAAVSFGFIVPMSPISYKTLNPDDIGPQFYDAISNLSPYALKDLQINYVYLINDNLKYYSKQKVDQLSDKSYFNSVYTDGIGTLFLVQDTYKNLQDDSTDLRKLTNLIPTGTTVYVGNFSSNQIAEVLLLMLSTRTNLIGRTHPTGAGYPIYVEAFLPYYAVCPIEDETCRSWLPSVNRIKSVDYVILDPNEDPNKVRQGEYKRLASTQQMVLWKNLSPELH